MRTKWSKSTILTIAGAVIGGLVSIGFDIAAKMEKQKDIEEEEVDEE